MKTLVVTTGNARYLLKVWLPTLRQQGEYNGNVLILDYDFTSDVVENLQKDNNILLRKAKRAVYRYFPSDRIRVFEEALKDLYQNYDVIMILDADIQFFKPIQPLFDMAQDKICYVAELKTNIMWKKLIAMPNADKYWEEIKNKPIINAGMFVGPAKLIYDATKFIADNLKYNNDWGYDQILFNVFIYCFGVPSQKVDSKWNYLYKNYLTVGKVFDLDDNEIAILHKASL